MSALKTFPKDPDAVLDYAGNWAAWLKGDTILTSTWDVPSGITKDSDSHTSTATLIWLSGGTVGQTYLLRNRITTAAGRVDDRTIAIKIKER
jgi:hypothetical protein